MFINLFVCLFVLFIYLFITPGLAVGAFLVREKKAGVYVLTMCVDADAPVYANHILQPNPAGGADAGVYTLNIKHPLSARCTTLHDAIRYG